MPNTREKLIELLKEAKTKEQHDFLFADIDTAIDMPKGDEYVADHLIANGVTVQEWISVKDRLPEQWQEVIVYSGGVLKPTVFAYQFWNKNYDSWARITHWMPLPEPPKP